MLVCLVLGGAAAHAKDPSEPAILYEACGRNPYYLGKGGFRDAHGAALHAYREFRRAVRGGALDPAAGEFFVYVCTLDVPGRDGPLFFHTPWLPARLLGTEHGSRVHAVACPLAPTEHLRIHTLIHSHPYGLKGGEGPSRVDVATASRYKEENGAYRYLYLVNCRGELIKFKARRDINPADARALRTMPVRPRVAVDWLD